MNPFKSGKTYNIIRLVRGTLPWRYRPLDSRSQNKRAVALLSGNAGLASSGNCWKEQSSCRFVWFLFVPESIWLHKLAVGWRHRSQKSVFWFLVYIHNYSKLPSGIIATRSRRDLRVWVASTRFYPTYKAKNSFFLSWHGLELGPQRPFGSAPANGTIPYTKVHRDCKAASDDYYDYL